MVNWANRAYCYSPGPPPPPHTHMRTHTRTHLNALPHSQRHVCFPSRIHIVRPVRPPCPSCFRISDGNRLIASDPQILARRNFNVFVPPVCKSGRCSALPVNWSTPTRATSLARALLLRIFPDSTHRPPVNHPRATTRRARIPCQNRPRNSCKQQQNNQTPSMMAPTPAQSLRGPT